MSIDTDKVISSALDIGNTLLPLLKEKKVSARLRSVGSYMLGHIDHIADLATGDDDAALRTLRDELSAVING